MPALDGFFPPLDVFTSHSCIWSIGHEFHSDVTPRPSTMIGLLITMWPFPCKKYCSRPPPRHKLEETLSHPPRLNLTQFTGSRVADN
jgi:hypothetical protein